MQGQRIRQIYVYMLVSYRLALFKANDFKTLLCHSMPGTHAVHHGN